jgi:hypothetical protein
MIYGHGSSQAMTWQQLVREVETDGDSACEALHELERRMLDLRIAHKCDKPLKHAP